MDKKIDLLLVELPDGRAVGATAPFNEAHVGDMVMRDDGEIGTVVSRLEWLDEDGAVKTFVEEILDVQDVLKVWQLAYKRQEASPK